MYCALIQSRISFMDIPKECLRELQMLGAGSCGVVSLCEMRTADRGSSTSLLVALKTGASGTSSNHNNRPYSNNKNDDGVYGRRGRAGGRGGTAAERLVEGLLSRERDILKVRSLTQELAACLHAPSRAL